MKAGTLSWWTRTRSQRGLWITPSLTTGKPTWGFMPTSMGFAFPVSHQLWAPFRLNALDYGWGDGPGIHVFGRLAPGVSLEEAQAELTTVGARVAPGDSDTAGRLRPRVMAYGSSIFPMTADLWVGVTLVNVFLVMLLVLVCANVALLMFARATTREVEVAVRSALGASRARIVTQLFVEALLE